MAFERNQKGWGEYGECGVGAAMRKYLLNCWEPA